MNRFVVLVFALLFAIACGKPKEPNHPVSQTGAPSTAPAHVAAESSDGKPTDAPGVGLRLQLLRGAASAFGIERPGPVWGVVMDIGLEQGTATVAALSDGNASLYTTAEFGILGGIGHERVRAAAKRVCSLAEKHVDDTLPTTEFPYPVNGKVRFYLLTAKGARTAEVDEETLGAGHHALSELFYAAHDVITELRLIVQAEDAG